MASWASIAKASPQPVVAAQDLTANSESLRLLVVDANAIIGGIKLDGIADRAVTIQEVLDEIRDKQSREFLANLPYKLQQSEPTEESIRAVTRFARETGDIAALSSTDIKLLALAHTLEVAAHGTAHLAAHATQPRMHSKVISSAQAIPGWGSVPNPEDWRVVDEANEQEEAAAAAAASTSRISKRVQQLSLDPSQPNSFLAEEAEPAAAAAAPGAASAGGGAAAAAVPSRLAAAARSSSQQQPAAAPAADVLPLPPPPPQQQQGEAAASAGTAEEDDDDGGWGVAASSKNAARRKKRKEYKRHERQRAFEQEWEEHAQLIQQQQQQPAAEPAVQRQNDKGPAVAEQTADMAAAAAAVAETASGSGSEDDAEDGEADGGEEITNDELLAVEHQAYTADDIEKGAEEGPAAGCEQQQQQQQGLAPGMPGWQSSVACVTADFAMQNVLLQMGLRLLARDGRRIARLSRYALRCSACFAVTREPGRLFCPKCGNMTLDRVEVVVGPDGAEYFGVRKRHILRGTKFSLPKPRGGRNSKDPVLREDVFLLKVKALGKQAARKKNGAATGAADAGGDGGVDPFAPEFNADTWHVQSQAELAQHRGLTAVLQPAWKNNPNERKLTRSNRRG